MNIVAASFTGLHNSRAFRAEKLVCVHGSATDDLQLSHQPSLPAQADVVAVLSNGLRAMSAWSVQAERLAWAELSVRAAPESIAAMDLSFGDDSLDSTTDELESMTLWSIGDDHGAGSSWSVSGHSLQ